jgi:hypothetical protein
MFVSLLLDALNQHLYNEHTYVTIVGRNGERPR